MKKLLPKYFDSEFSFAQFRIQDSKALCAFSGDDTLIAVTTEGNYYVASIPTTKQGGDCIMKEQKSLI